MSLDLLKGLKYTEELTEYLSGGTINPTGEKPFVRIYRDYMVMINNSFVVGDEKSTIRELSDYVVSINVNYNVDSPPGTCDITLRTPQHLIDGENRSLVVNDILQINEMDEVRVFLKNRFPFKGSGFFGKDEGEYGFSHVFWGIVTRVVDTDNKEENSITINCHDMTWWLSKMRANVFPSSIAREVVGMHKDSYLTSTTYGSMNVFDVMDFILKFHPEDLASSVDQYQFSQGGVEALTKNQPYLRWQQRYKDIANKTKIIGTNGYEKYTERLKRVTESISGCEKLKVENPTAYNPEIKHSDGGRILEKRPVLDISALEEIKPNEYFKEEATFESEFKNRLEIAQEMAQIVGFEFFQDTNGYLYFKPPYYNMYVSAYENPIYVVDRLDLVEADFSSDANDVVTELSAQGRRSGIFQSGNVANGNIFALFRDPKMATIYGIQEEMVSVQWSRTSEHTLLFVVGELDRINAKRFNSSLQIEGRPELRLGRPLYLSWRDTFYYIRGISHSYSNGSFKTTVELDTRRRKFYNPNLKNSRTPMPNAILSTSTGARNVSNSDKADAISGKSTNISGTSSGEAGTTHKPKEFLQSKTIIVGGEPFYSEGSLNHIELDGDIIRKPVSDQFGYELVGAFAYGRNLMISATGSIVPRSGSQKTETFASMNALPEGFYYIEKQDGHPDVRDQEFSPSFNDLFKSLFNIGRNSLVHKISGIF